MLKTRVLRCAIAAPIITTAAAFAPARRDNVTPPNLCALAARLNDPALTAVCGSIRYLGHDTFARLNLMPANVDVLSGIKAGAEGRDELVGKRHFFGYDEFVITVQNDDEARLDMVLRAAAAVARMRAQHPDAYRYITAMKALPTAPSRPATPPWKNRYDRIFISFDRTPDEIAAAVPLLGPSTSEMGVNHFSNFALISIDEVTILGATPGKGSQVIYRRPSAVENYRAYMADGLLYSLVHEATHAYIDYTNSTSRLANAIYFARGKPGTTDAEEVVANETGMSFVEAAMSAEMRQHVREQNTRLVGDAAVRSRLDEWAAVSSRARSQLVVPD
jgi:hypothetical protein